VLEIVAVGLSEAAVDGGLDPDDLVDEAVLLLVFFLSK
jgi:hypothetical protein